MALAISHSMHGGRLVGERSSSRFLKRLFLRIHAHPTRVSRRAALRRAQRELPDYLLTDVGVHRSELVFAIAYGRGDWIRFG
jgi:hypothetical protein